MLESMTLSYKTKQCLIKTTSFTHLHMGKQLIEVCQVRHFTLSDISYNTTLTAKPLFIFLHWQCIDVIIFGKSYIILHF